MLLKRKVRAGIMLYALLLTAIFAQLLQFYLNQTVASQKQYQALIDNSKAYIMAELTNRLEEKEGEKRFTAGRVSYQTNKDRRHVEVILNNQRVYDYQFLVNEESKATETEISNDVKVMKNKLKENSNP